MGYMCKMKYLYCCGPGHLVQIHGIMDLMKNQQIKNINLTTSASNLITGHVWIFQNKHQNQNKNGSLSTKPSICYGHPNPWPEHYRKWVGWTKEKKRQHGYGNLNDLERIWYLVRCSPISSVIIGEDSELLSWKKEVAKKYLIKCGK